MNARNYPELLSLIFVGLIVFFIAFPLDRFSGTFPGHFLGIFGAVFLSGALIYPVRKRILGKKGKANPLQSHVYLGLAGAILAAMHAGARSSSLIGTFVYVSVFLVVASGVIGRILLSRVNRALKERKGDVETLRGAFMSLKHRINPQLCIEALRLQKTGPEIYDESEPIDSEGNQVEETECGEFLKLAESIAAKEEVLGAYDRTKLLFVYWNGAHVLLSFFLFALVIVHVVATIYYGLRWLP